MTKKMTKKAKKEGKIDVIFGYMQKKMKIFSSLKMYYLSRFGEIVRKKKKKKLKKNLAV